VTDLVQDDPRPAGPGLTGARARRLPSAAITLSFAVVGAMSILAAVGPLLAPEDPRAVDLLVGATQPDGAHLLGTDKLGRDVLSRLLDGARVALAGPLVVALGASLIGNALGLLAGYLGGRVDAAVTRWADVMYAVPGLLAAIVIAGILDGGYWLAVAVFVLLTSPYDTRIIRSAVIKQRGLAYVEAARTLGMSPARIMVRELWPNIWGIAIANAFLDFAFALVGLSGLAFLGIGVDPGTPEWGSMLAENRELVTFNPAAALAPAILIALTAASTSVVGDWLYERISDRGRA
jgi:peptide/nickel transport system permease protein